MYTGNLPEYPVLCGIVLKAEAIGEYDRRIVILTLERGKISAFVKGARKPNNKFMAASSPFTYGKFTVYEGRNSFTVRDIAAENYFEELRRDYTAACMGMYMMEVTNYCTMENNDEREILGLLYMSLRALTKKNIAAALVRRIFEIRINVAMGQFPGYPVGMIPRLDTTKAVEFIVTTPVEKLFTFAVNEEVMNQLSEIGDYAMKQVGGFFKSLELINNQDI